MVSVLRWPPHPITIFHDHSERCRRSNAASNGFILPSVQLSLFWLYSWYKTQWWRHSSNRNMSLQNNIMWLNVIVNVHLMVSHTSTNRCSMQWHGPVAVRIGMSVEQNARRSHSVTNGHRSFGRGAGGGQISGRDSDKQGMANVNWLGANYIWGNLCYFRSRIVCLHHWPYTKRETKIYRTLTFVVALYGCETWSLLLRERHGLRVFENKVLREISGPEWDEVTGEWRKLHSEKLGNLKCWPNVAMKMTSRTMRWAGHVERSGEVT
jgi:hypothetical protein